VTEPTGPPDGMLDSSIGPDVVPIGGDGDGEGAREAPRVLDDKGSVRGTPGGGDASLLALVDRLMLMLERSDLAELEVEAGRTSLILRKPEALATGRAAADGPALAAGSGTATSASGTAVQRRGGDPERPAVRAPLTGLFYASPAPGSAPFVTVGSEIAVGTVIGLIEAMKLFNEIKSDIAGRVVRVVAESGALVKAKQPLIEVEPL
jgi:acetyl-CoA carboxylase biotin carboxyl carrier protein